MMSLSGFVDAPGRRTASGAVNPGRRPATAGTARDHAAAWNRLNEVPAGGQPIAFIAAEKEGPVFHQRSAERAAELIQFQGRLGNRWRASRGGNDAAVGVALGVEVVGRVEGVVAQVLEDRAADAVATRLGDHADLAARPGSEFRQGAARLDPELLNVFEARLKLEEARVLAVGDAWRGIDDPRRL